MLKSTQLKSLLAVSAVIALTSCGGDDPTTPREPVAFVEVTPANASILASETGR